MPWACLAQVDRHMLKRENAHSPPTARFAVTHEPLKGGN